MLNDAGVQAVNDNLDRLGKLRNIYHSIEQIMEPLARVVVSVLSTRRNLDKYFRLETTV